MGHMMRLYITIRQSLKAVNCKCFCPCTVTDPAVSLQVVCGA